MKVIVAKDGLTLGGTVYRSGDIIPETSKLKGFPEHALDPNFRDSEGYAWFRVLSNPAMEPEVPETEEKEEEEEQILACGKCGKEYKSEQWLKSHEEICEVE